MIYDCNGVVFVEDVFFYLIKVIFLKIYIFGDKKLYVEEKNFDKIVEILYKNFFIDKKDVLNILEDGVKKELY